jgi:hypothetical protein
MPAPFSAAEIAATATERAIARLLRGRTWQATTREIAWHAAAAVGGDIEVTRTVVGIADEVLSAHVDGIECRADAAAVRAWHAHVDWRPHDLEGAELVASIAAAEEAERLVAAAYDDARQRADEAARGRREATRADTSRRRGLFRRGRERPSAPTPQPPPPVGLDNLGESPEEYGWPRKDAA